MVFDNLGRQVATLNEYTNNQAYMEFIWKGTNDSGNEVPRGIYAFRIIVDGNLEQSIAGKVIKE